MEKNEPRSLPPQSFDQIYSRYTLQNTTFQRLERSPDAQTDIINGLKNLGQTRFINLVQNPLHAKNAIVLYAGDGVVTKITSADYICSYQYPLVVPPFKQIYVKTRGMAGEFVIENFPFLGEANSVPSNAVQSMNDDLIGFGLRFSDQDGRLDNIRVLANGRLAIIDGNAVQDRGDVDAETRRRQSQDWADMLGEVYPRLYKNKHEFRQSGSTCFSLRSYPAPSIQPHPNVEERPQFSGLKRFFMGLSGNQGGPGFAG